MRIADVMSRDVVAVAPETSVETAARLLSNKHITGVPVVTTDGRPVGVVSMSDLVDPDRVTSERSGYPLFYVISGDHTEAIGDDISVGGGQVADVMSPFVLSIESDATIVEAANRLLAERVHRLLVMNGHKLIGIVTSMDLLRAFVTATCDRT